MAKRAREYLKKPYARILIPDEKGKYTAEILEFPGSFAHGKTKEEALRRLERAAESWIEAALEQGQEIPEPFASAGFSGNFALRMPRSLHRRAVRIAQRDRVSLNQYLVAAISERVGTEDVLIRFADRIRQSINTVNLTNVTVASFHNYINPALPAPGSLVLEPGTGVISGVSSGLTVPVEASNA